VSAGRTEASLPHWRLARWVRFPRETFAAWSLAVADGITSPAEAVAQVRQHRTGATPAPAAEVPAAASAAGSLERPDPELAALSKADQLRRAFDAIGEVSAPEAVAWLMRRDVRVSIRYAHEVAAAEHERRAAGPELRAVEGGGAS
jgi:hypothetical protein